MTLHISTGLRAAPAIHRKIPTASTRNFRVSDDDLGVEGV